MANIVTVNSDITMRAQNGTEFTMGANMEDTLRNLIQAMELDDARQVFETLSGQH